MQKEWWQREIVYQIYPKSFMDSNYDGIGDINGIISKLDYLKDLGITMIWLCPIFKSPMVDNGYDVSDYFEIDDLFGSTEDYINLIEEAKKRDIKLMMDLVLNHTSDEHPWFKKAIADKDSPYRDYYIFKEGKTPPNNWRTIFGGSVWDKLEGEDSYYYHSFHKKQPDLNWENPKVREEVYNIVNTWIDRGIDAFRLDAINFLKKDQSYRSIDPDGADGLASCVILGRNQEGLGDFLKELKSNTFDRNKAMTVGETAGLSYDKLGEYIGEDGHFSMVFDFIPAEIDIAGEGWWFKRPKFTVDDLNQAMMNSQVNMQKHGWSANYIENHDQPRAASKLLKEFEENRDAVTMLASLYFFMRGTPYIYQGQELGMVNFNRDSIEEFDDISSIDQYQRALLEGCSEKEALEAVNARSRDNTRVPFAWDDREHLGFSNVSPWLPISERNRKHNLKDQIGNKESVFEFYKKMIDFRQNSEYSDTLIYGDISPLEMVDKNIIAYRREYENEAIECYYNYQDKDVSLSFDGEYEIIFTNIDNNHSNNGNIDLKPFQMIMIKK